MKLTDANEEVGFYEAFSDIIFATMAIFVLLMIIFLVLAKESTPIKIAQKKLESIQQQVVKTETDVRQVESQSKKIEAKLDQLSNKNVEIAIVVDKTGSMEQELYNLKNAIIQLAKILPKVMDSVRISVIAYRLDEGDRNNISIHPMSKIEDKAKDSGHSYNQLVRFLSRQRHKGGSAPILDATQRALAQFNPNINERDHQVFMLLGDVGPYEITYRNPDLITPEGERRASVLISSIKQWVTKKKNRNIIVLFSGRDELNRSGTTNARQFKHRKSMELFRQIAKDAGQPDAYTENQSRMLVDFLVAALKRK